MLSRENCISHLDFLGKRGTAMLSIKMLDDPEAFKHHAASEIIIEP
jgi:hypothetical protein